MPVQASRRRSSQQPTAASGRSGAAARPPGQGDTGRPDDVGTAGRSPRKASDKSTRSAKKAPQRKRKRRKDPLWARLVMILGAVLMVTSGVGIVGSKVMIDQVNSSIEMDDLLDSAGKTAAEGGNNLDGPIDLLLLGVDARERTGADNVRSDTIIVLHIPASHDQAYLISIPRDTEVQVPPFKKNGFPGGTMKATDAFFHGAQNGGGWAGGAQLMAAAIKKLTGISFDGAAIVNFGGFKKIIDALGTIPMCVRQEVASIHMTLVDGKPKWNADARQMGGKQEVVVHKKGCREMKSWEALDYARQRKGLDNGDYDRQQNQQQLIKAIAKKAMASGMSDPLKIKGLLEAANGAVVLDIGTVKLTDFVYTMRGVAANDLVLLRTNDGTFSSLRVGDEDREVLKPISHQMFKAVKNDTLGEFVINNPDVLAPSS